MVDDRIQSVWRAISKMLETRRVLTLSEVEWIVDKLALYGEHDDEAAHGTEDTLYTLLLRMAADEWNITELAKAALKTQGLRFNRWCA